MPGVIIAQAFESMHVRSPHAVGFRFSEGAVEDICRSLGIPGDRCEPLRNLVVATLLPDHKVLRVSLLDLQYANVCLTDDGYPAETVTLRMRMEENKHVFYARLVLDSSEFPRLEAPIRMLPPVVEIDCLTDEERASQTIPRNEPTYATILSRDIVHECSIASAICADAQAKGRTVALLVPDDLKDTFARIGDVQPYTYDACDGWFGAKDIRDGASNDVAVLVRKPIGSYSNSVEASLAAMELYFQMTVKATCGMFNTIYVP